MLIKRQIYINIYIYIYFFFDNKFEIDNIYKQINYILQNNVLIYV